jgi:hypothetical protein
MLTINHFFLQFVLVAGAVVLCQADLPVLYEVNQPNQNVVVFRGADLSLAQSQACWAKDGP